MPSLMSAYCSPLGVALHLRARFSSPPRGRGSVSRRRPRRARRRAQRRALRAGGWRSASSLYVLSDFGSSRGHRKRGSLPQRAGNGSRVRDTPACGRRWCARGSSPSGRSTSPWGSSPPASPCSARGTGSTASPARCGFCSIGRTAPGSSARSSRVWPGSLLAHAASALRGPGGAVLRIGLAFNALGYAALALTAARLLRHAGRHAGGAALEREGVSWLLSESWGAFVLEVDRRRRHRRRPLGDHPGRPREAAAAGRPAAAGRCAGRIVAVSRFGLVARGLTLAALGYFLIRAAEELDPGAVRTPRRDARRAGAHRLRPGVSRRGRGRARLLRRLPLGHRPAAPTRLDASFPRQFNPSHWRSVFATLSADGGSRFDSTTTV